MTCNKCNNEQDSGKFCGVCGSPLEQAAGAEYSAAAVESSPEKTAAVNSESMEKVKQFSGEFSQSSLRLLKRPAAAFQLGESAFMQGLVTLIIYSLAYTLSIYFLANSLFKQMGSFLMESQSLPFFELSSRLFLLSLIGVAISVFSIFIISKGLKLSISIKRLIAQFGGLLTPFAAVNLAAIIFGLSGSLSLTLLLLGFSTSFALLIVPILYIYHQGVTEQPEQNVFYWSLVTGVSVSVLTFFFWRWMVSDTVEEIESFINMFPF
ncbi:hypothetical protein [Halobacillus sp. B23F22_1]|uniref:hypothetical protein n=1 Tax=Halobacillus sp. B23F22_1 TaxID=3459514 RepID=UPI00373E1B7E